MACREGTSRHKWAILLNNPFNQARRKARELGKKALRAEEKKLQARTSSTFVVLRLQGDLAIAEIREINALTDYPVSLAQYHRVRGKILDVYNVLLQHNS